MKRLFALAILLTASTAVLGHHSFSVEFDAGKFISVTGTVSEIRFRNPHTQYFLDVVAEGQGSQWIVAGQNMTVMRRSGVLADTVHVGDQITVSGYAGRNGAHKVYLDSFVSAAGTEYSMNGAVGDRNISLTSTEIVRDLKSTLLEELTGDWAFNVDRPLPGAPFHLEFKRDEDGLRAVLDHEVVDVAVGEESFVMVLRRENRAGFLVKLELIGRIVGGAIEGDIKMIAGYSNSAELDAKSFSAIRTSPDIWMPKLFSPEAPVDLTGVWKRSIVLGPIGRTNPQLTEAGEARYRDYLNGAYDPMLRCMPVGPMRRQTRTGDIEILATTNRLTILYAFDSGVRRVWLDRDSHNTDRPPDIMGESIATWDGSVLVIDTRNLAETVLTHNSEPISSDARIVERYWLIDNGDLITEATLHDPKYYQYPIVKRLQWTRSANQDLVHAPCDPDSFYRSLQFDGALDSYYENQVVVD
jgi:uncharacterized protein DUF6152